MTLSENCVKCGKRIEDDDIFISRDNSIAHFGCVKPYEELESENAKLKEKIEEQANYLRIGTIEKIRQDKQQVLNQACITGLSEQNKELVGKIHQFRKDVLNPKNRSMTLFEKFDELFAEVLK
jgi:hypothetical protein